MDYTNKLCDYCKQPFKKDDDIVVCPDCGTPMHRECYKKDGKCVNEHLHETDFSWTDTQKATEPLKEEPEKKTEEPPKKQTFMEQQQEMMEKLMDENGDPSLDAYIDERLKILAPGITNEQKMEQLCGHNLSDVISCVGNNAKKYIDKFRKIEGTKHRTFNWAAFFLAPFWYFYRRMYKIGIIFMTIMLCGEMAVSSFANKIVEIVAKNVDTSIAQNTGLTLSADDASAVMKNFLPVGIFFVCVLILHLISGFFGDKFYHSYCKKTLDAIDTMRQDSEIDPVSVLNYYSRHTSTSIMTTVLALFIYEFLPTIVLSFFA